jgi:hypothetical protein
MELRGSVMNPSNVTLSNPRMWDLGPGDTLHGRTIAAVQGVVGLASNPVAIIFFQGNDTHPARFPAAYPEALQHGDDIARGARRWIQGHQLHEGDAVDLQLLRSQVMGTL